MNLRWLLFDYVDPKLSLTKLERRHVRRRARHLYRQYRPLHYPASFHYFSKRSRFLGSMICLTAPGAAMIVAIHSTGAIPDPWQFPTAIITVVAITWTGFAVGWRLLWKPYVNQALRENGWEVCPKCGYFLRGLRESDRKCPECGLLRYRHLPRAAPIQWDESERMALRREGYDACMDCGAVHRLQDKECPECGAAGEAMPPQAAENK